MSEFGDLLELLHTGDSRWSTLRASGRHWWHFSRTQEAFRRAVASRRGATAVYGGKAEVPQAQEQEEPWRLWLAPPDRVRAEFVAGDETVTAVIRGDTWWSWSPSYGARTNRGNPQHSHGTGPADSLVYPATILPVVHLRPAGELSFVGRSALAVRALPIADDPEGRQHGVLHGLGSGADAYDLIVDAKFGVLLRSEAYLHGESFNVLEMQEAAFDEEFPPETFELKAPEGELFERVPEERSVPLRELQEQVPFTVLVPAHPPVPSVEEPLGVVERASIMPAVPRLGMPMHVHFSYASGRGRLLTLRESADPMPVRRDQRLKRRGDLLVGEDRAVQPARTNVRVEQDGTDVELEGMGMTLKELIAVAGTLVPLPPGPPPVASLPTS